MHTIALELGCYSEGDIQKMRDFITERKLGQVGNILELSCTSENYRTYVVDVHTANMMPLFVSIEQLAIHPTSTPPYLAGINFTSARCRVVRFDQDITPHEIVSLVNECFSNHSVLRATVISMLYRVETLEQNMTEVANFIDDVGDDLKDSAIDSDDFDSPYDHKEVKVKWLH